MTDAEMFQFLDTFRSLRRVFPLRGDAHDDQDRGASYFKALRKWPLRDLQAGADRWLQIGKHFPKPAEWIDAIPKQRVVAEVVTLEPFQAAEWLAAERRVWEDSPCGCSHCRAAMVDQKPLRFVPEFNADGTDRRVLLGDRVVTAGHWAHGTELAAYYRAKEEFYARFSAFSRARAMDQKKRKKISFRERLDRIFSLNKVVPVDREPGEEG